MKKFLYGILFFAISGAYSAYAGDSAARIEDFWNFVSENEAGILDLQGSDSPLYSELFKRIQSIDENIFLMVNTEMKDNKRDIVITCGGKPDYFGLCDEIVSLAPEYERLNPVSLFPPLEKIEPFVYGNIMINPEDVKVHFDENGSAVDLLFLLNNEHIMMIQRDTTGQLYGIHMQMLFVMTQQILGERIFGEKIKSGLIMPAAIAIGNIPLLELRDHIK